MQSKKQRARLREGSTRPVRLIRQNEEETRPLCLSSVAADKPSLAFLLTSLPLGIYSKLFLLIWNRVYVSRFSRVPLMKKREHTCILLYSRVRRRRGGTFAFHGERDSRGSIRACPWKVARNWKSFFHWDILKIYIKIKCRQ